VNEACSLIRGATANEDAQINFGVVLNESLKDTVKITVIATGFQRDNQPQLQRREPAMASVPVEPIVFQNLPPVLPPSAPEPVPVPEPMFSSGLTAGSSYFSDRPAPDPEPVAEPVMEDHPQMPIPDDLEVPAFMRRERRLYQ
jgi:cell division protein FtsZ